MDGKAVVLIAAAIFLWGAVSARLERADLTAPIVFTVLGALLAGLHFVDAPKAPLTLKPLVELTLVWVLFSDAARVRVQDIREDLGRCLRLLGIGLPLAVLAGWDWNEPDKLNVNGSGISLGHPIGATGARMLATGLRELRRRGGRYLLETMCVGGGQGVAAVFEAA